MADFRVRFHPAGFDDELRVVLEDVRAGRWRSMRDLLATTDSWTVRTARSQVLAAAAATSDAVEAWGQEARDHHWLMMRARVLAQRALNAHRAKDPGATAVADQARFACGEAARHWPADPVPWVVLLALAQVDAVQPWRRRPEHWMPPWEPLLPYGPWGLLYEAHRRDPYNREAWHRMLQALTEYGENATDFVRWVATWAPQGSPLAVLPLHVYARVYQQRREEGVLTALYWTTDPVSHYTRRALTWWFEHADRATWSPLDLNHLAQALHSGGFADAAPVWEAIGPCATPIPWKYVADYPPQWQEEFLRARRHYLPDAVREPVHAGRHR
ncbi:hypothetical protein ACFPH6_05245 [Streptomyces xiangluensis]|uniref:DUF4034 domain-containing protein n=1 Tax=Streptomyces xiangluensis TaxID=2665720 RepID=A0ABV8YJC3_9ACTN